MSRRKEESVLDLKSFDFNNETKVLTALSLLPKGQRAAFLLKLRQRNEKGFFHYVQGHMFIRTLVLEGLEVVAPGNKLSSLLVQRTVVNNASIANQSTKTIALCDFKEESIFDYVRSECGRIFG